MTTGIPLPPQLEAALGGEPIVFAVQSPRRFPAGMSRLFIGFALLWLMISTLMLLLVIWPLFMGESTAVTINGVKQIAGPDNLKALWKALLMPILFIGFFELVGVVFLSAGFYLLLARGGWFVGTSDRLLVYRRRGLKTYEWKEFSTATEVKGNEARGTVTLYQLIIK